MRDFHETIDILVKAYLNNTLEHHKCSACAVTNIIGHTGWTRFFVTIQTDEGDNIIQHRADGETILIPSLFFGAYAVPVHEVPDHVIKEREAGLLAIESSGYSIDELARIEFAFETSDRGNSKDEHMFNGLVAIVDVLAEIHGIDLEQKEEAKALFVKS